MVVTICGLFLGLSSPASAQISTDPASAVSANAISTTFAHTVGTGANRLLIVAVSISEADSTVANVSYAGQALTLIAARRGAGNDGDIELWGLKNPPSGNGNVVVTLSKSRRFVAGAMSFANVDQVNTYGTIASAMGDSLTASVTATSATNELVVSGLVTNGDTDTASSAAGQTSLWVLKDGTGGAGVVGAGATKAGATSTTLSWTLSRADAWAAIAVPIRMAASATLTTAKSSSLLSDSINGTANPKAIPGAVVTYTINVSNSGDGSATLNSTIVTDSLPPQMAMFVGDYGTVGSGPVAFTQGSPSSGLTYTYTSLASTADSLSFSNNGGVSYTYTPVPDASGYDSNITHFRVAPGGAFAGTPTADSPGFQLQVRMKIR